MQEAVTVGHLRMCLYRSKTNAGQQPRPSDTIFRLWADKRGIESEENAQHLSQCPLVCRTLALSTKPHEARKVTNSALRSGQVIASADTHGPARFARTYGGRATS